MSLKTVLVVILAVIFGGSAAVGITNLRNAGAQTNPSDMVDVVVAKVDVARGTMVTADMLSLRKLPKDNGLKGMLSKPDEAVDRVAFSNVSKGNPVLDSNLAARGAGRGLAALIPKGMRAFTIQTPSVAAGVAGFLLPGNKVDVLLTVNALGGGDDLTGGGSTTTLLQNIEVLAVDQHLEAPSDNKVDNKDLRSVTLLVTPDQAARLDLGQNKGTLHLSLRRPDDHTPANTQPATLAELRFHQEKPWDERLRGVLDALAKVSATVQPKPAPRRRGPTTSLATLIPKGMRAHTILTPSAAAGVAGFLVPGNKVDVLLTMSGEGGPDDTTGGGSTTTLLQDIKVLAVDQLAQPPSDDNAPGKELSSVTLLVTPDQAAKLDLGQNRGTLHLTLRNPNDQAAAETRPTTVAELRPMQPKAGPVKLTEPSRPGPESIRTLRGIQEGQVLLEPKVVSNANGTTAAKTR